MVLVENRKKIQDIVELGGPSILYVQATEHARSRAGGE